MLVVLLAGQAQAQQFTDVKLYEDATLTVDYDEGGLTPPTLST